MNANVNSTSFDSKLIKIIKVLFELACRLQYISCSLYPIHVCQSHSAPLILLTLSFVHFYSPPEPPIPCWKMP